MVGYNLVTKQTPSEGVPVSKVWSQQNSFKYVSFFNSPHHKNWHTRLWCGSSRCKVQPIILWYKNLKLLSASQVREQWHYASLHSAKDKWAFYLGSVVTRVLTSEEHCLYVYCTYNLYAHFSVSNFLSSFLFAIFLWLFKQWQSKYRWLKNLCAFADSCIRDFPVGHSDSNIHKEILNSTDLPVDQFLDRSLATSVRIW